MRDAAVIGSRGEALKDKDPKLAKQYAGEAKDLFQGMLIGHPKNYDITKISLARLLQRNYCTVAMMSLRDPRQILILTSFLFTSRR
jgi:hypothetical protein